MFIKTVVRGIRLPTDKPLREGFIPFENGIVRLEPMQVLAGQLVPESERIRFCFIPKLLVLFQRLDLRFGSELGARRKQAILLHDGVDLAGIGLIHQRPRLQDG